MNALLARCARSASKDARERAYGPPYGESAVRSDEKAFFYNALTFFERTLDPIYVIPVSVRHRSDYLVVARSRVTKEPVRNTRDHLTNVELAHLPLPRGSTVRGIIPVFVDAEPQWRLRLKKGKKLTISVF